MLPLLMPMLLLSPPLPNGTHLRFRGWSLEFGFWVLGFGVWGLGFGFWGLGFGVWGLECRKILPRITGPGLWLEVYRRVSRAGFTLRGEPLGRRSSNGLRFEVQESRIRVQGSGFKVQGSGFKVSGQGFRFQG